MITPTALPAPTQTATAESAPPHAGAETAAEGVWRQVSIEFTDYNNAEQITADHLQPLLRAATTRWWFIRKAPCWRLRYLPTHPAAAAHHAPQPLTQTLQRLQRTGVIASWAETIYEPETYAFGGTSGMHVAHRLFHHDSRHVLGHPRSRAQQREMAILLCATLLRGAGLDWYEQGDVWARVADNRPPDPDAPRHPSSSGSAGDIESRLRRLLSVDTSPHSTLVETGGQLADAADWLNGFHSSGRVLAGLAGRGDLSRGLRGVLTHHVLFQWNRIGLPYDTQSLLAHACKAVVLAADDRPLATTIPEGHTTS